MDENTIIDHLEELAERFGVQIHYEVIRQDEDSIRTPGGLCLFQGKYVLVINMDTTWIPRLWIGLTPLRRP